MIRLSSDQQRVLAEMTWQARTPVEVIARRLKLRSHTVRHAMRSLQETLHLTPMCWTHPYLRGQAPYRVFFSLDRANTKTINGILDRLTARPEVVWLASLIGQYHYVMGIRGNGLPGVVRVFGALDQEFGELVVDRSISPILQMSHFVPWLAHGGSGKRRYWKYHVCDALSGLDESDEKILKLLQRTPLATTRDISQNCGIPASTVAYRLERLLTNGIIIGFGFGYDDRLLGKESVILSITTHGFAGATFDAFFEYAQQHPRVSWVAQPVGTSDVELGVILEDAHELNEIIREVSTFGKGAIKNVHCHALVKTFKS